MSSPPMILFHPNRLNEHLCRDSERFKIGKGELTLWPWKWTFKYKHIICVKCEYFANQNDHVMKYTIFCRGIN